MTDISKHSLSLMFESLAQSATWVHIASYIAFMHEFLFAKLKPQTSALSQTSLG